MKKTYFYGYNIVAAGFMIQAVAIGAMFTYGIFFKTLQAEFGWSRAMVSGASSLAFLVMGAGALVSGWLNDRIGPRIILTVSGAAMGLGYLLMSRLTAPWQLYLLYGGLVGIGFSTHDVITLSTVARWFEKRRGMMTGLVKVGTGAGQFVGPLIAAALIADLGWKGAYLTIGGIVLAILVALAQVMKRDPQGSGLLPDGRPHSGSQRLSTAGVAHMTLQAAARTRQFWTICLAEFAIFFCLLTTIVHIVPHARDLGLDPPTAAAVLSTIGAVSMVGRFVVGTANDRLGGRRSLLLGLVVLIISLVWVQFTGGPWRLFVFAVLYGFAHGALFTVMSPTVAEFFGTAAHGRIFGAILFSGTIGGSIGPLLTGYIFDISGSYRVAFAVLTTVAAAGWLLIASLRPVADADH